MDKICLPFLNSHGAGALSPSFNRFVLAALETLIRYTTEELARVCFCLHDIWIQEYMHGRPDELLCYGDFASAQSFQKH